MKPSSILALVLSLLFSASSPREDASPSRKPTAPLEITATVHPGDDWNLRVRCLPTADGDLLLEVDLPPGTTFLRGRRSLSCAAQRGCPRFLDLVFRPTDSSRREITVRATLVRGTARLTRIKTVVLNDDGTAPPSKGVPRVDSLGRSILEFRAR